MSQRTIKVYLAAIRLLHLKKNYDYPTKDAPLLRYLCTAIWHHQGDHQPRQMPITIPPLHHIKAALSQHPHVHLARQDKLLYWAAFTLAFCGFLCVNELTSFSTLRYNPRAHIPRPLHLEGDPSITPN